MGSNNLQIRFITINKRPMDSVLCSFRRPIFQYFRSKPENPNAWWLRQRQSAIGVHMATARTMMMDVLPIIAERSIRSSHTAIAIVVKSWWTILTVMLFPRMSGTNRRIRSDGVAHNCPNSALMIETTSRAAIGLGPFLHSSGRAELEKLQPRPMAARENSAHSNFLCGARTVHVSTQH